MERIQIIFLELYRCALTDVKADADIGQLDDKDWNRLMRLSDLHHVCPMIYEALWDTSAACAAAAGTLDTFEDKALKLTLRQAHMSAEFLKLYQFLGHKGLHPAVLKGIICRSLYPNPEHRYSTDEDLFIPEDMFEEYNRAFLEYGLVVADPDIFSDSGTPSSSEVSYCGKNIFIELHMSPFPPESEAYGDLNRFFADSLEHTVTQMIYGVPVHTLGYTDHLLYLLCHCYKHFLNCGIGIRQVSDIILYSLKFCEQIDWDHIVRCCRESDMFDFSCAVYRIGDRYLAPGGLHESLRNLWLASPIDENPLLLDILAGGIYGTSSLDRLHSSNFTLNAMGKSKGHHRKGILDSTVLRSLFPSVEYMKKRYRYVRRFPAFLPVGWLHRMAEYGYESILHHSDGSSASDAFRIGNERVKLMREYRILNGKNETERRIGLTERLKRIYQRSHYNRLLAPVLSPLFMLICDLEYNAFQVKWFLQGERQPNVKEVKLVRKNVTFLFKSFERQKMAQGLCRNISRMYPGVRIVVADDSKEPLHVELDNVTVVHLPFNSGLGAGLEAALEQVRTPYVVRLDDDELLTLRTKVHRELRYLHKHPELDIIGFGHTTAIRCRSPLINFREYYEQPMNHAPRPLKIPHMTEVDRNHIVLGKVANIYLARTEKIREIGYDPNIRIIDHDDFFRRAAGIAVSAVALDTVVFHRHNPYDRTYRRYRSDYSKDMMYIRSSMQKENSVMRQ